MPKNEPAKPDEKGRERAKNLRQQAESLIRDRAEDAQAPTLEQYRRQSHELAVHQIELQVQNEELKQTQLELLTARDRYIDLYDFAPVGYLTLDEHNLIEEANLTAAKMLGKDRQRLLHRRLTDFVAPGSQERMYLTFCRSIRRNVEGTRKSDQIRMLRPDGFEFWARLEGVRTGRAIRLAIIDITDLKEAEQALTKSTAELEMAHKELQDLDFALAQDLKAGLRRIGSFSQTVLEDHGPGLDKQATDYLTRIHNISGRMGSYLDSLLKLSEITSVQMEYAQINLSTLAESIALKLKSRQPERRIELIIQQGVMVNGDYQLLYLALEKLLENAFKFTARCEEARIELGLAKKPGKQVHFVRDNGIGFDMKYADRLFIPFQSLHSEEGFQGDAVGLAIVQRIVHRHGGRIWAEGKAGEGATFYFTLGQTVEPKTG